MLIPVLIDRETLPDDDPEFEGRTDPIRESMEFHVIASLRELGYDCPIVPFGPDPLASVRALADLGPDLVFNLTEHFHGDRRHDAHIAGLLDLMNLPYTGSGPVALSLCRDKIMGKRLLAAQRIQVPRFHAVPPGRTTIRGTVRFPLIVKPAWEDGSDGISLSSVVDNSADLEARIRMIHDRMKQPAICEQFIEGRELYVGVIGNERRTAFPAREIRFGQDGSGGPTIATSKVKWDDAYRDKWGITYAHADLPEAVERKVAATSKKIMQVLQMRDYGRVDLRLTPEGRVVFLEANANPNIAAGEDVAEAAEHAGIGHTDLIDRIVQVALRRVAR